jgi:hypothetical protein
MPQESIITRCICGDPSCEIPYGFCHCGCGCKTSISCSNKASHGYIKGTPKLWSTGHYRGRKPRSSHMKTYAEIIGLPLGMTLEEFVNNGGCICGKQNCRIPYGTCHCGCGEITNLSEITDEYDAYVKGKPKTWVAKHYKPSGPYFHKKTSKALSENPCVCGNPNCLVSYEICHCGCGRKTRIANRTHLHLGDIAGRPRAYCKGHNAATHRHTVDRKPTPTFRIWSAMISRCNRTSDAAYENYGGRGISVCQRWRDSFENFLSDMGERPDDLSIDRINNDGNYEPGNCKWATREEQARNKRSSHIVIWEGMEMVLKDLSILSEIPNTTLLQRLQRGMTPEQASSLPKFARTKKGER